MAAPLTLDSVVQVPLPLHGFLGHNLKQVVGMGDNLHTRRWYRRGTISDLHFQQKNPYAIKDTLAYGLKGYENWTYHVPGELH